MRRKSGTGLVKNEERVLAAALALHRKGEEEFHGYRLVKAFRNLETGKMAMSTLYRCLLRLEERGLLSGEWRIDEDGGARPTRFFQLTGEGLTAAADAGFRFKLVRGELQPNPVK